MYLSVQPRPILAASLSLSDLGKVRLSLLLYLNKYHYLTSHQLCRLRSRYGNPLGTLSKTQTHLFYLKEKGYVQRERQPTQGYEGKGPYCYSLTTPARQLLAAMGESLLPRFRPREARTHGLTYIPHTIALNDVLISFELLSRQFPNRLRIVDFLHEREMKRQIRVEIVQNGRKLRRFVEPDAFLTLEYIERGTLSPLLVELDNTGTVNFRTATERQRAWKLKVQGLVSLVKQDSTGESPYERYFGRKGYTFVVPTLGGERRRDNLTRWTKEELSALGASSLEAVFFFTAASAVTCTPEEFACGRQWATPAQEHLVSLVQLSREAEHV